MTHVCLSLIYHSYYVFIILSFIDYVCQFNVHANIVPENKLFRALNQILRVILKFVCVSFQLNLFCKRLNKERIVIQYFLIHTTSSILDQVFVPHIVLYCITFASCSRLLPPDTATSLISYIVLYHLCLLLQTLPLDTTTSLISYCIVLPLPPAPDCCPRTLQPPSYRIVLYHFYLLLQTAVPGHCNLPHIVLYCITFAFCSRLLPLDNTTSLISYCSVSPLLSSPDCCARTMKPPSPTPPQLRGTSTSYTR